MIITVGTFNLNNLFSRYNFTGEIKAIRDEDTSVDSDVHYEFKEGDIYRIRTYMGRLVKAKDEDDTTKIAERIDTMNLDILAVQEVEDVDTLLNFNRNSLNVPYPYVGLIEGNDPRLIDVGILSRYPLGGMTSWKHAVHSDDPSIPIFGRDLAEVEVYNMTRSRKLFTIYNNHLKSHFVDFREDEVEGEKNNTTRRTRQSEKIAEIVKQQMRPDSSFIILGDMNDPPNSKALKPFVKDNELDLINALKNPKEQGSIRPGYDTPDYTAWTYRHKESGVPAEYKLYDQIWLSRGLEDNFKESWINRRYYLTGDGSDHDPAWVVLEF